MQRYNFSSKLGLACFFYFATESQNTEKAGRGCSDFVCATRTACFDGGNTLFLWQKLFVFAIETKRQCAGNAAEQTKKLPSRPLGMLGSLLYLLVAFTSVYSPAVSQRGSPTPSLLTDSLPMVKSPFLLSLYFGSSPFLPLSSAAQETFPSTFLKKPSLQPK